MSFRLEIDVFDPSQKFIFGSITFTDKLTLVESGTTYTGKYTTTQKMTISSSGGGERCRKHSGIFLLHF